MTHAHIIYMTFKIFRRKIEKEGAFKCPNLKENLLNLARMFALNELIANDCSSLYETGYFSMGVGQTLLDAAKALMTKLRPQMIPLIEACEFPDFLLVSCIGNSYGDIYE